MKTPSDPLAHHTMRCPACKADVLHFDIIGHTVAGARVACPECGCKHVRTSDGLALPDSDKTIRPLRTAPKRPA